MSEESPKIFSFEIIRDWDSTLVQCHGRLVAGTTDELFQAVKRLLPQTKVMIVDLADVTYLDSMGLGMLVRLYVSGQAAGCELKLLNLGKQVRNVLRLTNLFSVFAQAEEHGITIA